MNTGVGKVQSHSEIIIMNTVLSDNFMDSSSNQFSRFFSIGARIFFVLTVVLIPIRWRISLLARPNPPVYRDYTDFLLFAPDIAMLVTLTFWGLSFLFKRRMISFGPAHIWVSLLGLTLAGWVSLATSWDSPLTVYHAVRLSLLFVFFLFIVNEIHSPIWVIIPVGLQVLIQSVVAIKQSLLQHDLGLQSLGEYELDPLWQGVSILEAGDARFLRAYGLSDHPNILGGCLAFGLVILLAAFVYQKESVWRWLIALTMIPTSVALLLTFSRSAWIAFFIGSLLIVGVEALKRNTGALKRVASLALVCLLAASPFIYRDLPYLSGRLSVGNSFAENRVEHGSLMERAYLFDSANRIFVDHALTGVGLGVSTVALKAAYPVFPLNYQPPHFTLLTAAFEVGLLGAMFYLFLLIFPIMIFVIRRNHFIDKPEVVAGIALLLSVSIAGLFDYYTWLLTPGRLWQWTTWGLWAVVLENRRYAVD